jgi:hypothetical protein
VGGGVGHGGGGLWLSLLLLLLLFSWLWLSLLLLLWDVVVAVVRDIGGESICFWGGVRSHGRDVEAVLCLLWPVSHWLVESSCE